MCVWAFQSAKTARKVHAGELALRDLRIHEYEQRIAQQESQIKLLQLEISLLSEERDELLKRVGALARYTHIVDVEAEARDIAASAEGWLEKAKLEANH